MNTQELARKILDTAIHALNQHGAWSVEARIELLVTDLEEIAKLCESELPQVTNYESEDTTMGGKPKTNTPADQRLKANNPNAGKPKTATTSIVAPVQPMPAKKPAPTKKTGK